MTLIGKPQVDEDLLGLSVTFANQAALLSEVITELIGEGWKHSFSGFTPDITVDISYRMHIPDAEQQRTNFLLEKAEKVFRELLIIPSRRGKIGSVVIRKEILEMMTCLIKYKPIQRYASFSGSLSERR